MRYAQIRRLDISNGDGVGASIFVQGCNIHCKGCFNQSTWNFCGGKEYDKEAEDKVKSCLQNPNIVRFSILGGEPLCKANRAGVLSIIKMVRELRPDVKIYCWTGNTFENLKAENDPVLEEIFSNIDILIDGPYKENLRDLNLKFRGSSNQRILYHGKDF